MNIEDYEKSIIELHKLGESAYYIMVNDNYPERSEIDRTNETIRIFNMRNGRVWTELYNQGDVLLLTDVCENFIKISKEDVGVNLLFCVSLPRYKGNWEWNYAVINLERIMDFNHFQMF